MKVFMGTGPDGQPVYGTLNDLLDEAAMQRQLALEDVNLFQVAAECLIGVS